MFLNFIKDYPVGLPKLNIVCCGGGYSLSGLLAIPNASRVIFGLQMPYDELLTRQCCGGNFSLPDKIVSEGFVQATLKNFDRMYPETINVVVTAAYISSRYRRGDNHAFYGIKYQDKIFTKHIQFGKYDERMHSELFEKDIIGERKDMEDCTMCTVLRSIEDFTNEITVHPVA